ncbi:hypothetical protein GH714_008547 [Hevea brasiliensis]|uniref:RBR-type E3 ubiquitin transferase n=1 Tax=Hevea brasiliensis TaxID=3981 RepID=A0A6A6M1S6_HEVBR|nr:hypothetical protein GH714_008547 [Hevea brasiliensis]
MEDYGGSDDECYYSDDRESLNGLENEDSDFHWVPSKGPTTRIITKESLLAAQREDLRRVMELLSLREHHARTLLIHYRWDVERLFAVFVEKGKSCLFTEAGVTVVEQLDIDSPLTSSSTITCDICIEDVSSIRSQEWTVAIVFAMIHFIVKINEGQSRRIRCMAHKCNAICDEAVVRSLVSKKHPDLAEKFDRFLLESYIEDNKMVKWCPSTPHCGNAIRIEEDECCEVECSCSLQFCFSCLSEAHSPCSCLMWELWSKKCRDESETVNWITVHTKPCPKCHKPVEKNGGCNLVSCICGQSFWYECIESDLLGSLQLGTHNIAPYKSKGIEKASELSCWSNKVNATDKCLPSDGNASGGISQHDRPSGSRSSADGGCSSRKRARKEGGGFLDLNLPAEIMDRN